MVAINLVLIVSLLGRGVQGAVDVIQSTVKHKVQVVGHVMLRV